MVSMVDEVGDKQKWKYLEVPKVGRQISRLCQDPLALEFSSGNFRLGIEPPYRIEVSRSTEARNRGIVVPFILAPMISVLVPYEGTLR